MHLAWRVTLKAPFELKSGLLIEPLEAVLNGSLMKKGIFIGWSSLSLVNSSLLEWRAEEDAVSAKRNESESAKATAINQSPLGLFSRLIIAALDRWGVLTRAIVSTSSGHFDGIRNRCMCYSGGLYRSATAFSGSSSSKLLFSNGRRVLT